MENAPRHEEIKRIEECARLDCETEGNTEGITTARAVKGVITAVNMTRDVRDGWVMILIAIESDILQYFK